MHMSFTLSQRDSQGSFSRYIVVWEYFDVLVLSVHITDPVEVIIFKVADPFVLYFPNSAKHYYTNI